MKLTLIVLASFIAGAAQIAHAEDPQSPPPPRPQNHHADRGPAPAPPPATSAPRAPQTASLPQRNYGGSATPRTNFNVPRRFEANAGDGQMPPRYRYGNRALNNPTAEQPDGIVPRAPRLPSTASIDVPQQPAPATAFPRPNRGGRTRDGRNRGAIPTGNTGVTNTNTNTNTNGGQVSPNDGLASGSDRRDGADDARNGGADWRHRHGGNGNGDYSDAWRRYHHDHHDSDWWRRHCDRIVLFSGGYYYWDTGYWYPAWGYDTTYSNYAYDGPIYGYDGLPPDEVISSVQTALQEEGYYRGAVDGELGPLTRQALAAWQRDHGLAITTAIDEPTMQSLGLR